MEQPDTPQEASPSRSIRIARVIGPVLPRPGIPWMTLSLTGVNVLMALAQLAASGFGWRGGEIGATAADWALGAKVPSLIARGEYWRLVTANFLHGSWFHLASNMAGLLVLGCFIEYVYGPWQFLAIFAVACVAGATASYHLTPFVSLGASTGVMGLMGALLVHNFRFRRALSDRLNTLYPLLIALLFIQLTTDMMNRHVDLYGHLGGLGGGAVFAALAESRLAGSRRKRRDWLPAPVAAAIGIVLLGYGGLGLFRALPAEADLLRAGKARAPALEASLFERVVQRRPYFLEARFHLTILLLMQGRAEEATAQYEEALRASPEIRSSAQGGAILTRLLAFHRSRGWSAYNAGQWGPALDSYRHVMVLGPTKEDQAEGHNQYAWVLADKLNRNLAEAEAHARQATRLRPGEPAYLDTLAWVHYKQGKVEAALEEQEEAVQLREGEPTRRGRFGTELAEYHYHLAAIYEKKGRRDEARAHYLQAWRLRGNNYPEAMAGLKRLAPPGASPGELPPSPGLDPAVRHGII